jgi:fatty acid-binding protein DegV
MAPDVEEFAEMLAPIYPADRTIVGIIGPVIGTHSGLGAIGVAFQLALGDQSDPPGSEH